MPKLDMVVSLQVDLVKDLAQLRRDLHDTQVKVDVFREWFDRFRKMTEDVETLRRRELERSEREGRTSELIRTGK